MEFALVFLFFIYMLVKIIDWAGKAFGTDHKSGPGTPSIPQYRSSSYPDEDDKAIRDYGINEIKSSGRFSASERAAEYRRRGQSPSGVIDGVYNDTYRGNGSYNDTDRDWEADA